MDFLSYINEDDIKNFLQIFELFENREALDVQILRAKADSETIIRASIVNEKKEVACMDITPLSIHDVFEPETINYEVQLSWILYLHYLFGKEYEYYLNYQVKEMCDKILTSPQVAYFPNGVANMDELNNILSAVKTYKIEQIETQYKAFLEHAGEAEESAWGDLPRKFDEGRRKEKK